MGAAAHLSTSAVPLGSRAGHKRPRAAQRLHEHELPLGSPATSESRTRSRPVRSVAATLRLGDQGASVGSDRPIEDDRHRIAPTVAVRALAAISMPRRLKPPGGQRRDSDCRARSPARSLRPSGRALTARSVRHGCACKRRLVSFGPAVERPCLPRSQAPGCPLTDLWGDLDAGRRSPARRAAFRVEYGGGIDDERRKPRRTARELARAVEGGRDVGAALRHLDGHGSEPEAVGVAEALARFLVARCDSHHAGWRVVRQVVVDSAADAPWERCARRAVPLVSEDLLRLAGDRGRTPLARAQHIAAQRRAEQIAIHVDQAAVLADLGLECSAGSPERWRVALTSAVRARSREQVARAVDRSLRA
jgi:hypothetical protein